VTSVTSVVSDVTGVSATALIDGERRGAVLADLAPGRLRTAGKTADLSMALAGRFTDHHALMCRLHLDRIQALGEAVAGLGAIGPAPHQHFATAQRLASRATVCPGNYMSVKRARADGPATAATTSTQFRVSGSSA
jgi:hypothetical protein